MLWGAVLGQMNSLNVIKDVVLLYWVTLMMTGQGVLQSMGCIDQLELAACLCIGLLTSGPMLARSTVPLLRSTLHPDELLTRVALHWPDLGNQWNHVDWRLTPVHEARIASCLQDLQFPTYVLVMPGLLRDLSHRPHGLLEVAHRNLPCQGYGPASSGWPSDSSGNP